MVGIYISGHPLDDFRTEINAFSNANVSFFTNLDRICKQGMSFAGVITDVQHRVSKNGKGWGFLPWKIIQTPMKFRIFGEEYLKFRHFLMINSFVYVKVFVREGWTNKDTGKKGDARMQFVNFMLLHDIMEKYERNLP